MQYLIFGGCGFLGSNLSDDVLSRGATLCIYDDLSKAGSVANLKWLQERYEFEFINDDVRNASTTENVVRLFHPDVIIHLAGQVAMTTSIEDPRTDFEINALGTLNVLEAARIFAPSSLIIYSSTNKVYGSLEQLDYKEKPTRYVSTEYPNGFDEMLPLRFGTPYGCSKGAADQYVLDYARRYGVKTIVFRHSSIYGSRQFPTYDQGWVGWFCQKAIEKQIGKSKEPFTISGNGKQVRDLLHVDDATVLYRLASTSKNLANGEAFNIGGGIENSVSLLELFNLLEKHLNIELSYKQTDWRPSDQKVFISNTSKTEQAFGWKPKVPVFEGISKLLNWLGNEQVVREQ